MNNFYIFYKNTLIINIIMFSMYLLLIYLQLIVVMTLNELYQM